MPRTGAARLAGHRSRRRARAGRTGHGMSESPAVRAGLDSPSALRLHLRMGLDGGQLEQYARDGFVLLPRLVGAADLQRYESRFVRLWDQLLRADDTFQPLAEFPFSTLSFGEQTSIDTLELGIRHIRFGEPGRTLSRADWRQMLADYRASGYRILQTEWHHGRFEPPQSGLGARSEVSAVIHVEHPEMPFRAILRVKIPPTKR